MAGWSAMSLVSALDARGTPQAVTTQTLSQPSPNVLWGQSPVLECLPAVFPLWIIHLVSCPAFLNCPLIGETDIEMLSSL